jgi:hypothetical protein
MRKVWLSVASSFVLLSHMALAQPAGETIGHLAPIPGPPPVAGPPQPATPGTTAAASPQAGAPVAKGYTGAYSGPPPAAPTPYTTGPLPLANTGPGLNVVGPDGVSTKAVKSVPCGSAARETDGFTTCVGISDEPVMRKRR